MRVSPIYLNTHFTFFSFVFNVNVRDTVYWTKIERKNVSGNWKDHVTFGPLCDRVVIAGLEVLDYSTLWLLGVSVNTTKWCD